MDLRKLMYLEAIYRLGSFTKASEELHVSQPAITNAMNALEQHLGVELMIRGPKILEFTEAGERLVHWARRIMADFSAAEREMAAFGEATGRTLHLGISNMVGSWIYSEVYSPFIRKYPESNLIIKEYPWAEICRKVADAELDMAYTTWEKDFSDPQLELHRYLDSELYLVLPPKHPLTRRKRIPLKCLEYETLWVFAENSLIRKIVVEQCAQAGISPRLISVTQHVSTMQDMVENGAAIGFSVRDRKSASINKSRYVLRPLDPPVLLETGFITRKGTPHTKIMRNFAQFVKTALEE